MATVCPQRPGRPFRPCLAALGERPAWAGFFLQRLHPVRRVDTPKANGGTRPLGLPTVADRIVQEVVRRYLELLLEPVFHKDSYGYRPGRSAIDAVRTARERCWRYNWILDLDIKGFFDNIDRELLLRAVRKHTQCRWVLLYIERWLKAPAMLEDGTLVPRDRVRHKAG